MPMIIGRTPLVRKFLDRPIRDAGTGFLPFAADYNRYRKYSLNQRLEIAQR